MSKFKIGDKAIYLTDEIEVEVEIYRIPQDQIELLAREKPEVRFLLPELFKIQIVIKDRIKYVEEQTLFEKNSEEYIIAKLNKLERKINRGFFARIFNR
jgi:rRNA processing protein Krr1/Pno1